MPERMNRLLIVDDEPRFCAFVEKVAAKLGFETYRLTDSLRFMEVVTQVCPSVLMLDLKMPGCDGVQLLQQLKDARCAARIILVSGMDQRTLQTAERLGRSHGLEISGVLQKPVKLADLRDLLQTAASSSRLRYTSQELESAIREGELVVHYQPKATYGNGHWTIDGAEALVRWQHSTDGLVMPGSFLPLAEESGLIGPITDQVLRTTIQQIAEWLSQGLELNIAVNLSARLIEDLSFPDRVRELLKGHAIPGSSLTLELTESAAMSDPSKAMDIFVRLRISDVGLAIDDFGTGYSSLKQLYELPFDELKIDRTFVAELPDNEEARAIVRATVEMAHALNMTVCAEGVETRGALKYLESVGCDKAQGFLFSQAVSGQEFERLIGRWASDTSYTATGCA